MEKYTQEEIKSLQKALSEGNPVSEVPTCSEIKDVISMVNQGVLKMKDDDFGAFCHRSYWSSDPSKDRLTAV